MTKEKIDNLIEMIQKVSKMTDKEGNIIGDQDKYYKLLENIRAELQVPENEEIEELQKRIKKLKEELRNHDHKDGKVVVEL